MPSPRDPNVDSSDDERSDRTAVELSGGLKSFEAHLAALAPRSDRLDRERLAFLAGQASMTVASQAKLNLLGKWQRHPAWPVAFAGMSAIAALLFVALMLQPDPLRSANAPGSTGSPQTIAEGVPAWPQSDFVLSIRDSHTADFDARLDRFALGRADVGDTVPSSVGRELPVLTPARWQQVIRDAEPTQPSGRHSSGNPQLRDTQS